MLRQKQRLVLESIVRRQTSSQRLVRRAQIILEASTGASNERIAKEFNLHCDTVRIWRERFRLASERLGVVEWEEGQEASPEEGRSPRTARPTLSGVIEELLQDEQRPGCPATFTSEQIVKIIAVACEEPSLSDRPVSHWTARELADEVRKREIVEQISARSVGRFLKSGRPTASSQPLLAQYQSERPGGL